MCELGRIGEDIRNAVRLGLPITVYGKTYIPEPKEVSEEHTYTVAPDDNGPKGYYGPAVRMLCMSDGTVRWEYASD